MVRARRSPQFSLPPEVLGPVFGVPLNVLMNSARQKGRDLPVFVERALTFLSAPHGILGAWPPPLRCLIHGPVLRAEGLFRLSGQQTTIDSIKESLDAGKVRPVLRLRSRLLPCSTGPYPSRTWTSPARRTSTW